MFNDHFYLLNHRQGGVKIRCYNVLSKNYFQRKRIKLDMTKSLRFFFRNSVPFLDDVISAGFFFSSRQFFSITTLT